MKTGTSMRRKKQTKLTDYFRYHNQALPISSLSESDKGKAFATLLDLPNELLLCVLDQLLWDLREFDAARRLYGVCQRFYAVFGPKAFQSIVCRGTKAIERLKIALTKDDGLPTDQVKHAHFHYLALNQITFSAVQQQLVPSIKSLSNLTSLTFQKVVMSVELVVAMGLLPNLTFLIYDIPYPNGLLSLNPAFGTFTVDELAKHPRRAPSKLQSISIQFQSNDAEYFAFAILYIMLRASRRSLRIINIDFNCCCGWMPVHRILYDDYPNLYRISLYHANFTWSSFTAFYEAHAEQLKHVSILFVGARRPDHAEGMDQFFLREIPGLERFTAPQYKVPTWHIEMFTMNLSIDQDCKVTAHEMSMVRGRWEMLPHIVKEHPHLRVLNMWDGQVILGYEGSIFQILSLSRKDLQSLEVLRFNCGRRGLNGLGRINIRPLGTLCEADRPNSWCSCLACDTGVYTPEERIRIRQAWEENEWHGYQEQIRKIIPFLPKLRLIEWFLGAQIRPFRNAPIPFWQWQIDRNDVGGEKGVNYKLKRKLNNWQYSNPLTATVPWTPDRGMEKPTYY